MAAPAFVQQNHNDNSGAATTTWTANYTGAQTAGNCNVVFVFVLTTSGNNISSLTDTSNNTYQQICYINGLQGSTWFFQGWLYVAKNIAAASAGANTVTANFTVSTNDQVLAILEYSGASTTNPVDGFCTQFFHIAQTQSYPGAIITSQANDTLVSIAINIAAVTWTVPTGFTSRITGTFAYQVADGPAATAGFYNPIWSANSSHNSMSIGVALSPTTANPPTPTLGTSNGLSLVPQMGFDTWRYKAQNVTQAQALSQVTPLVNLGLKALGYVYFNVSDSIYTSRSGGNLVANSTNFPTLSTMISTIQSNGLLYSSYLAPGPHGDGCNGFESSGGFEVADATLLQGQGVKYIMYDSCYDFVTPANAQAAYTALALACKQINYAVPILASCPVYADGTAFGAGVSGWVSNAGCNLAITAFDLGTMTFTTFQSQIDGYATNAGTSAPGRINWPDFLGVANGTLSVAEGRSNFAIWAILAAPLWISCDLTVISQGDLATLSNTEIIAVDQDPLALGGQRYVQTNGAGGGKLDVWAKQLSAGEWAIAFLNRDSQSNTISVNWSQIPGIIPRVAWLIRDVFGHVNVGISATGYSTTVQSHDTAMIVISDPLSPYPPSGLTVAGGIASWFNNEPAPASLFLETSSDQFFRNNLQTQSVPDILPPAAQTATVSFPNSYYRIRITRPIGTAYSNVAHPVTVSGGTGYYAVETIWGGFDVLYLSPNVDYENSIQSVMAGPFTNYWNGVLGLFTALGQPII